jgi:polyhydroxybutyrate depolymerase
VAVAVPLLVTALALGACSNASSSAAGPLPPVATHGPLGPGDHTVLLTSGGHRRSLILHVPPGAPVANRPLILVYHGATDTAGYTERITDFDKVANKNGDLVAFMQGYDNSWNEDAGSTPAHQARINDVAFTAAAIKKLETLVPFDHNRIAAAGFSNGALMVQDLGCKLAGSIAVIVPVEGELPVSVSKTCKPSRAIEVYEIHGTADTAIPYKGGSFHGVDGGTTVLSAPASLARWATLDVCSNKPATSSPSRGIKLTTYRSCHRKVTVVLRTIVGGVHQWGGNIGELVSAAIPAA